MESRSAAAAAEKRLKSMIDEFFSSLTSDLIKEPNLRADIKESLGLKLSVNEATRIRDRTMEVFKKSCQEGIERSWKKDNEASIDKMQKPERQRPNPWRPCFEPEKDTFAQRLPVYLKHIQELETEMAKLESEVQTLNNDLTL